MIGYKIFEDFQLKQAKKLNVLKKKIKLLSDQNENNQKLDKSSDKGSEFSPLSYFIKTDSINSEDEALKHKRLLSGSPPLVNIVGEIEKQKSSDKKLS